MSSEPGTGSELRDKRLIEAFATLADTLVDDYDIVDLLQTLVEICDGVLDVEASGILLADEEGELELMVSTSEESRLVEVMQLGAEAGPCIECFRTGEAVSVVVADAPPEWIRFREAAHEQGFASVQAIPMRLRESVIGTLNLFRASSDVLAPGDLMAAQALADVATIGILHERSLRETDAVRDQLQKALNSRVVIEQAKGVLAHTHGISPDEAFGVLRQYARSHQLSLGAVADDLVNRRIIF
ncbi:GAF and ANTAR domain-containing protein [Herbiconiux sp.]|uniref:GAF and ANTAR domain-containing protein n=1 Tax=Herbiconiux sp. TaxID=1871186 RepID=UPI0025C71C35|nr:GAF and ANTAR domain-containing protein [Herbiconiux sp.]